MGEPIQNAKGTPTQPENDYSVMLNAFAKAGFEHLSRLEHDQEGHRSIRVGEIIFWFDSENLVRVQLKRILVCQPAELR